MTTPTSSRERKTTKESGGGIGKSPKRQVQVGASDFILVEKTAGELAVGKVEGEPSAGV